MAKDQDREALRQAAESAERLIKKHEAEKIRHESKIAFLRQVINAWNSEAGKKLSIQFSLKNTTTNQQPGPKKRVPRGQAESHIDAVLGDGGSFDEVAIQQMIQERFQITYNRNSIHSVLTRRHRTGKYAYQGGEWCLPAAAIEGVTSGINSQ